MDLKLIINEIVEECVKTEITERKKLNLKKSELFPLVGMPAPLYNKDGSAITLHDHSFYYMIEKIDNIPIYANLRFTSQSRQNPKCYNVFLNIGIKNVRWECSQFTSHTQYYDQYFEKLNYETVENHYKQVLELLGNLKFDKILNRFVDNPWQQNLPTLCWHIL